MNSGSLWAPLLRPERAPLSSWCSMPICAPLCYPASPVPRASLRTVNCVSSMCSVNVKLCFLLEVYGFLTEQKEIEDQEVFTDFLSDLALPQTNGEISGYSKRLGRIMLRGVRLRAGTTDVLNTVSSSASFCWFPTLIARASYSFCFHFMFLLFSTSRPQGNPLQKEVLFPLSRSGKKKKKNYVRIVQIV